MEMLEIYLKDNDRRLFEISESFYIKRVHTENGIYFECTNEPTVFIAKNKKIVRGWFEYQTKEKTLIELIRETIEAVKGNYDDIILQQDCADKLGISLQEVQEELKKANDE